MKKYIEAELEKVLNEEELKGLAAWLPPEGAPHIFEYSNLLRQGLSEAEARSIVEDKLRKCGIIK